MAKNTETTSQNSNVIYLNSNKPKKVVTVFKNPTKTQISLFDNSPQEVLDRHGMYRDPSVYKENPEKIYCDTTGFNDLQETLNKQIELKNKFNSLPVDVRARFGHDIIKFAQFCNNSDLSSDDFLKKVTTESDYHFIKKHKERKENEKLHKEYLESDEYKSIVENNNLFLQYQQENFENWKKSRNNGQNRT